MQQALAGNDEIDINNTTPLANPNNRMILVDSESEDDDLYPPSFLQKEKYVTPKPIGDSFSSSLVVSDESDSNKEFKSMLCVINL